ncbi:alpha/beta fold hydrolase [Stigmatella aurantiaca]|uniref:Hydrolase, alpha/beta fold family n=1 Tax=Stigmatella aurantiaca (strain DW4/3-1) TaxID=378806 RepID=Q09CN1_STIAD|nr:alpha/beta fold hydrolase [Stigmatella aurantiaca]ADO70042.1 Hydrolase, alpha/beta fold family [Stigmatella aurantiaca DW4/3-1]EAU69513.1 hydrolase, alpha/beta fold family protein [Stigmatella aurantiaca DW4/3-1]
MHPEVWAHWGTLIVLLLILGNVLWVLGVRRLYRPRTVPPQLRRVRCQDGWEIAVHVRRAPVRRFEEPVLLCHGLSANRFTFDFAPPYSVAHYLAEAGFDCFSVEWRGTGHSRRPALGRRYTDFTVDDHIHQDGPALLEFALAETGAKRAFWLGHSLGALVGYGVAQGPHGPKLAGILALGAPVFLKSGPLLRALVGIGVRAAWPARFRQEWMSATLAPFLGYVTLPLSELLVNPQHIPPTLQRQVYANMMSSMSRKVLLQFRDWIEHDAFRSYDRTVDWRAGLSHLTQPMLVMGGSSDRLATPENVRKQYELLTCSDRTLHVFGRDRGDKMDYGHGDLIFGTGAPIEVYPLMGTWLQAHATPMPSPVDQTAEPPTLPA